MCWMAAANIFRVCVCVIEFKLEQLSRTVNVVVDVKKKQDKWGSGRQSDVRKFWKILQWKTEFDSVPEFPDQEQTHK